MTRNELKEWAKSTVDRILHGHHEETSIDGYLTRGKYGELAFSSRKPLSRNRCCWDLAGRIIWLDMKKFPSVKWEDAEPTPCKITISISKK